ncbi:Aspartyl protease UND [Linum perenne]
MDTGSDFLWVKCLPCSPCSPSSGGTFFDPTKSKTYVPRPCTKECSKCTGMFNCKYTIGYAGGLRSEGVEATEQLTFQVVGGPAVVVPKFQFGCSSSLTRIENFDRHLNGVLPLGMSEDHENSLVARFGYKFSYCVGSIVDRSNLYNHLSIGDGAYLQGDSSTPLRVRNGRHYYVFLSHFTLNDKVRIIHPNFLSGEVITTTAKKWTFSYFKITTA